jgi:hypothetical protein
MLLHQLSKTYQGTLATLDFLSEQFPTIFQHVSTLLKTHLTNIFGEISQHELQIIFVSCLWGYELEHFFGFVESVA